MLRGQQSKKGLRTNAGMGKTRADKYEGKNGRKREEELETKMGTPIDLCLQTNSLLPGQVRTFS